MQRRGFLKFLGLAPAAPLVAKAIAKGSKKAVLSQPLKPEIDGPLLPYAWLIDALKPRCDKVITNVSDYGQCVGIGVEWGKGKNRRRTAIMVEQAGWIDRPRYSLNAEIAAGRFTRKDTVKLLLQKR